MKWKEGASVQVSRETERERERKRERVSGSPQIEIAFVVKTEKNEPFQDKTG